MTIYRPCVDCLRPMRGSSQKLADHPGTVCHKREGRCATCNRTYRGANPHADTRPPVDNTPLTINPNAPGATALIYYQGWRRKLGARVLG